MSKPVYVSYDRVNELFYYDKDVGLLVHRRLGRRIINVPVNTGYMSVSVDYRQVPAHRVIYLLHNPDMDQSLQIDHINGVKMDNRIENLRLVTEQENHFNRRDVVGFTWGRGGWRTYIVVSGKYINLGNYDNKLDARAAYLRAKKKYHIIEER
tara:strand:+ start:74 stop:532 length:459 start_codon:yes stop_codon:yes gene_type:complete